MLSVLASILKVADLHFVLFVLFVLTTEMLWQIILGSLVANYFNSVFAGGWWAGAVLLIASLTGIFSFTG